MNYTWIVLLLCFSVNLVSQADLYKTELVLERVDGFAVNDKIPDLRVERDKIYIASSSGVRSYNNKTYALDNDVNRNNAVAVTASHSGKVFSAFADNSIYSGPNHIYTLPDPTASISDIELFRNKLWIGTNKGLYIIHPESGQFYAHKHSKNSELKSDMINFTFYSKSHGTIWIGTDRGVVEAKDHDEGWQLDYRGERMIAATENKEGLWLLSNEELYLMIKGREYPMGLKKGLHSGEINDLALDSENILYVASDILTRYNPYRGRLERYSENLGLVASKCLSLASDEQGALWLGTENAGLYRIYTDSIQIERMRITIIPEQTISCHDANDASLRIEVNGGQGPYRYMWSPVNLRGENPTNLKSGNYSVTVEDILGNRKFTSVRIQEPDPLSNTIVNTEAVSKAGRKDGKASVEPSGGTPPYEILWDNGETGREAKKLNYGFNYLTITDSNGCSMVETVNIKKPKLLPELDIAKLKVGQTLMIDNLFFQADSSTISSMSHEVLEEVYEFMSEHKNVVIEIGGHTNSIPPDEYCDRLSTARARTVAEYLYSRGLDDDRISYKGYGKREPIASNDTAAGRKKNQRVEIKILRLSE